MEESFCKLVSKKNSQSWFCVKIIGPNLLKNHKDIDQMIVQPPFQPLSAYSLKQISDGNNFKQTILNIIKNSTDIAITLQHLPSSITTIQQLGLGITHAFSTLIINSFKKLIHSQTSPAFDHYDFLLPRDQIVGLLLDNSL